MILRHTAVGSWSMNAYALVCPSTGQSVLIDPGADPHALQLLVEGTQPTAILVTHSHFDHIGALHEMRRRLKVPVMGHDGGSADPPVSADVRLRGGERLPLGVGWLTVTHVPGHTPDQLCFGIEADPRVIVGDFIFEGGPGRTETAEAFCTTLETLRKIVPAWPDETICFPGHGAAFRLGAIRRRVERFVRLDHGAFCGDATWEMNARGEPES
jgi:hydroxyacylglutathione hydrolase